MTCLRAALLPPLAGLAALACLLPAAVAAEAPASPNILYVISDDQTWFDFGFMGNERVHTPHLDRLAERSVRFPRGYLTASVCRPSLVSLLTGLDAHEHGIHFNHGPPGNAGYNRMESVEEYLRTREREFELIKRVATLPGLLRESRGYRSLQTGKFWEGHWENGGFTEGMTTFTAPPESQTYGGVRVLASGDRVAHGNGDWGLQIGRETLGPIKDFVRDCEAEGAPWLVWYAPYLPHLPHDAPERYVELAAARPDVEEHELPYFAAIAWFDDTVGELLDFIERESRLEDTVVVFVTDNGWTPAREPTRNPRRGAFDQNARSKRAPFDEGIRSPILLSWPGQIAPATREDPVSSLDIVPTLLRLAGAGESIPAELPGRDLLADPDPERILAGAIYPGDAESFDRPEDHFAYRWILRDGWKLIVPRDERPWGRYVEEPVLFHVAEDPWEERDLAADPEQAGRLGEMRELLDAWWPAGAAASGG